MTDSKIVNAKWSKLELKSGSQKSNWRLKKQNKGFRVIVSAVK